MDKHLWGLNPDVNEFIDRKKNLTVIGLYWAGYWRLVVAFAGIYLAVLFSVGVVAAILG